MKVILPFKIVYDDQDITPTASKELDYSRATRVISAYDLNAMEAAAQFAAGCPGTHITAISVGSSAIDDAKLKKSVLARGIDDLFMIADDSCDNLDAFATAQALKLLVEKVGDYDVIICGDGSADLFAQQVDVQLAAALNVPHVNGVTSLTLAGDKLVVERLLENELEKAEVPTPAVVSIAPDAALPRICSMKDILAAGKKEMSVITAVPAPCAALQISLEKAPDTVDRRCEVFDTAEEGGLSSFISAVKVAI